MTRIVGNLLRGWGPLSISGGSSPPNTPTLALSDNADGTGAVASIAGSSAGSTNAVYTSPVPTGSGALVWSLGGTRTGDGAVPLSLNDGYYLAYCESTLAGLAAPPSDTYALRTTGGASSPRSIAAAGHFATALDGVAWLIASSSNFQALVGANSPDVALDSVKLEADDTEESGSVRPRAIVYPAVGGFELEKVALDDFRPRISLYVSFEFLPANTIEEETTREHRWWDEMLAYLNTVEAIIDDCLASQGQGAGHVTGQSQVSLNRICLVDGPSPIYETREEGQAGEVAQYFYGITLLFEIHG